MVRRDSLCNTGDTQGGVAYQISGFVLHKNVIGHNVTGMWEIKRKKGRLPGLSRYLVIRMPVDFIRRFSDKPFSPPENGKNPQDKFGVWPNFL